MSEELYRVRMQLQIAFTTAFHLGSGLEGEAGSDHGILTDPLGLPVIPGSSLKGILRSTVERLVASLRLDKIWACGLENGLYSSKDCIGGGVNDEIYKKANKEYQDSDGRKTSLIEQNCCTVCHLFGSPLSSARLFIHDAALLNPQAFVLARRDGVGICRDSGTAKERIKYDYDTANPGLRYKITLEGEEPDDYDMAVLALGVLEWCHSGLRIGGKTSRGLGHAVVEELQIETVDLQDPQQRKAYLLEGRMQTVAQPQAFLQKYINELILIEV